MSFIKRTLVANIVIDELEKNFWRPLKYPFKMVHDSYGYETHISADAQNLLKGDYSTTSKHIRFTPDYVLIRRFPNHSLKTVLLEYKVTRTPRFTLRESQWFEGQIEADAWENYMNLRSAGIEVAIVIYCPYHPRPLLCDYPNQQWVTNSRQRTNASRGSGTDYVNIRLQALRTFDDFMLDEFGIPKQVTEVQLSSDFFKRLRETPNLAIEHDSRSYFKIATGSNWMERYRSPF